MALLTDSGVRHAKPQSNVYTLSDGRGLSLRVEPNGSKCWHFRFYWQGKQQRVSFGTFPDVSLKDARQCRDDARAMVAGGVDPRVYTPKENEQGMIFETFSQQCIYSQVTVK